jgi:hypothetical protein
MRIARTLALLVTPLALGLAAGACNEEEILRPNTDRVYDQIDRLGNPLVSEVTISKRNHPFYNSGTPSTDVMNFGAELEAFVTSFGRPTTLAQTLSGVLLPDMLIVDTSKPGSGAGWLTWALASGYGGRALSDDVVDAGLQAIFGSLITPTGALPAGLQTDNVSANNKAFLSTFPYLATAN